MRGLRLLIAETAKDRVAQALAVGALLIGTAALAAPVTQKVSLTSAALPEAQSDLAAWSTGQQTLELVWQGVDVDGDGSADFANPTGQAPRGHDAYGDGEFGARRDGGSRRHEGVDFMAEAGQPVAAPMSGYVTKIGYAYAGDANLKFVEITNPALRYQARVFYVNPTVEVGDPVRLGEPVGEMHSLQRKYPGGMTDHVHLEIVDRRGRHLNALTMIQARYVAG